MTPDQLEYLNKLYSNPMYRELMKHPNPYANTCPVSTHAYDMAIIDAMKIVRKYITESHANKSV